jgi:hypothetical protein
MNTNHVASTIEELQREVGHPARPTREAILAIKELIASQKALAMTK